MPAFSKKTWGWSGKPFTLVGEVQQDGIPLPAVAYADSPSAVSDMEPFLAQARSGSAYRIPFDAMKMGSLPPSLPGPWGFFGHRIFRIPNAKTFAAAVGPAQKGQGALQAVQIKGDTTTKEEFLDCYNTTEQTLFASLFDNNKNSRTAVSPTFPKPLVAYVPAVDASQRRCLGSFSVVIKNCIKIDGNGPMADLKIFNGEAQTSTFEVLAEAERRGLVVTIYRGQIEFYQQAGGEPRASVQLAGGGYIAIAASGARAAAVAQRAGGRVAPLDVVGEMTVTAKLLTSPSERWDEEDDIPDLIPCDICDTYDTHDTYELQFVGPLHFHRLIAV